MQLPTKPQVVIAAVIFLVGLGAGRYSNRLPASDQTKTTLNTQKDKDKTTDKTTTIVKDPTGKETTTIVEETHTVSSQNTQAKTQETIKASPQLQASILGGIDIHTGIPTYGAAVSKQILGPVTLGVFGLTDGVVGVSVGMTF